MDDTAVSYFRKMFKNSDECIVCIDRYLRVVFISHTACDLLKSNNLEHIGEVMPRKNIDTLSKCIDSFTSSTFNFLHIFDDKPKKCIMIPISYNKKTYAILTLSEGEAHRFNEIEKHQLSCIVGYVYDTISFSSCAIVTNVEHLGKSVSAGREAQEIVKNALLARRALSNLNYLLKHDSVISESHEIDINQYLSHALPIIVNMIGENRLKITLTCSGGSARIVSDVDILDLLVTNIISNSVKNTTGFTKIDVRTTSLVDKVVIQFSDNGCGLSNVNEILSRDANGSQYYGTPTPGTGLFVIKKIAEDHGGTLFAKPSSSGGLTLGISIPKVDTSALLMSPDHFPLHKTSFSPLFIGLSEVITDFSSTPLI